VWFSSRIRLDIILDYIDLTKEQSSIRGALYSNEQTLNRSPNRKTERQKRANQEKRVFQRGKG